MALDAKQFELYKQLHGELKAKPVVAPEPTVAPATSTPVEPQGDTGLKGFATGVGKGVLGSAIGTTRMLQSAGQGIIAAVDPNRTYSEVKEQTGFKSLQGEQAAQIDETLTANSTAEKVGKVAAFAGEIINPVGRTEEVAALTGKAISVGKKMLTNRAINKGSKEIIKLADATSGVADKGARISALEKTGMKGGAVESGPLGAFEISADVRALERAKAVKGIVKPGASPIKNLGNLNKEIGRISEKEVLPALKNSKAVYDVPAVESRLKLIEKPDLIKADVTLDNTYELVRNRMIDQIKKQPKTMEGLWNARKEFDKVVKDQFGDVAFDSEKNTAIKRAVSDMRREINKMIGESVPEYQPQMDKITNMYDARFNIAEQYQTLINKGGIEAWKTKNPKLYNTLKYGGLGGAGLGAKEYLGF